MRLHGPEKTEVSSKKWFFPKRKLQAMNHHDLPRIKSRVVVVECWLKGVLQEAKMVER